MKHMNPQQSEENNQTNKGKINKKEVKKGIQKYFNVD